MCELVGGAEYRIDVAGEGFLFEMNERCGPVPISREIAPKHAFWRAVSLWIKQGHGVDDGEAIWEEPREAPMFPVREVRQCECGEQMYRTNRNEPFTCWPCESKP